MKTRTITTTLIAAAASLLPASLALAFPIDPAKVPVDLGPQSAVLAAGYTLAYDTSNPNIIYYAPRTGRTATLNGAPLIGFAVLPNGESFFNAQVEFGVFGASRDSLFQAIANAGKTPVQFPYVRTRVKPMTPKTLDANGQEICTMVDDPVTGEVYESCKERIYREVIFSDAGPSLGEHIAISAYLKPWGTLWYQQALSQTAALMINLEAEYHAAGTPFSATVTVNYDKLFRNFHAFASFHGFLCIDIQLETFFREETLCIDRDPSECGVWVTYSDGNGTTTTATIDPDNEVRQNQVAQAAERLADRLREEMFAPIQPVLDGLDTSRPVGFKLSAQYEQQKRGMHATFTFNSPRGVNLKKTVVPIALGCVKITPQTGVTKETLGVCQQYWQ